MATYQFKLPDIGEGIAEAEIVAWHIKVGERVEEDQQLADMMTDKATVEMESPVAGTVKSLAGEVGDQVAIGSVLVEIETDGAAAADTPIATQEGTETVGKGERTDTVAMGDGAVAPTKAQEEALPALTIGEEPVRSERKARPEAEGRSPEQTVEQRPSTTLGTSEAEVSRTAVLASPVVRQRARDLGIDLAQVKTAADRVRHADLDAYLLYNSGSVSARGTAARQDEQIKVVGLRRKIAENMQAAKRRVPHFTLVEEFDVTALEDTRAMMNRDRGSNPKLTLLPFLITAMTRALPEWPMLNATYDDEANVITRHGAVHMGIAAQTANGLMVPVLRNAEAKSVWQLAAEVLRLSDAAKTGKATREELTGPTITISSLGPMGGITSTPVISPPQVAIIAVNKVEEKLVPVNSEIEVRKRMNLSLSCDHRVVDGWDAASFLQAMKPLIENPLRLLA
ncbi:dihydrolipoamide acetyltransferase family protein [uncultured Sphingomonas sp.]|uniref:dihydrolipoamide acetyltransferase family protein n=1 Tax=uncultured Sphingomonas sp. TaxID=158754 RepID=UPI0025EC5DCE|nr:dihydrolipoamide acetyltransferase family protein [uncultured Sphingomonas sp.]